MKTITTTAIVALLTAAVGLGAVAPAMAQGRPAPMHDQAGKGDGPGHQMNRDRHGPRGWDRNGGGLGGLLEFGRSSEAIELALVRISHQIELTPEQTTLLDTFKTDALAAQAGFETAMVGIMPNRAAPPVAPKQTPPAAPDAAPAAAPPAPSADAAPMQRPDFSERLDMRIAMETAHLAALTAVQPAFDAFFDSLTDEQKAELTPERRGRPMNRPMMGQNNDGPRHQRPGGMQRPAPMPDAPMPGAATPAAPAPTNG